MALSGRASVGVRIAHAARELSAFGEELGAFDHPEIASNDALARAFGDRKGLVAGAADANPAADLRLRAGLRESPLEVLAPQEARAPTGDDLQEVGRTLVCSKVIFGGP